MTASQSRAIAFLERTILRGIEGFIADRYLGILVTAEWRNTEEADEAMLNQFEAKNMAEATYAQLRGWTK